MALLNRKLAGWLLRYNEERPHEGLSQRTPIAALTRERSTLDHLPRPPSPRVAHRRHSLDTARPVGFGSQ